MLNDDNIRSKRIIILGINYSPELIGIGKYTTEMVNWMVNNNYICTVVTSYPYYPHWIVQAPYKNFFYRKEIFNKGKLTIYRCPIYIPEKPTGFKRIIHDATFFVSAFFVFIKLLFLKKHDYVISIAPPFHIGLLALLYRFIKGGKVIYHVQDLQIDAAKELNMIKSKFLLNTMFSLEKLIVRKADYVSSISDGMINKIKGKTDRDVVYFPNWVDVDNFKPLFNNEELKKNWGFEKSDYVILYSGSLGEKQGLNIIVDLALRMQGNSRAKFVICGTGSYKHKLETEVSNKNLSNVTFLPLQNYAVFNMFLNMADMHLILQKNDASDLVMPSKLSAILSVGGLALVTAMPKTSLYEIIKNYDIGLLAAPEQVDSISNVILENINKNNEDIRKRARQYAKLNLSINCIMPEVFKMFIGDDI